MTNIYASKSNAIAKAAALIRGDRLNKIRSICETQKTISTSRLEKIIDNLHEDMKLDGIFVRELSKKIDE